MPLARTSKIQANSNDTTYIRSLHALNGRIVAQPSSTALNVELDISSNTFLDSLNDYTEGIFMFLRVTTDLSLLPISGSNPRYHLKVKFSNTSTYANLGIYMEFPPASEWQLGRTISSGDILILYQTYKETATNYHVFTLCNLNDSRVEYVTMTLAPDPNDPGTGDTQPLLVSNASHTPTEVRALLTAGKQAMIKAALMNENTVDSYVYLRLHWDYSSSNTLQFMSAIMAFGVVEFNVFGNEDNNTWGAFIYNPLYEFQQFEATHNHGILKRYGYLNGSGSDQTSTTIASGDRLVIADASQPEYSTSGADYYMGCSSISFGTSTSSFLANNGTWQTPANTTYETLSASAHASNNSYVVQGIGASTNTTTFLRNDGTWATPQPKLATDLINYSTITSKHNSNGGYIVPGPTGEFWTDQGYHFLGYTMQKSDKNWTWIVDHHRRWYQSGKPSWTFLDARQYGDSQLEIDFSFDWQGLQSAQVATDLQTLGVPDRSIFFNKVHKLTVAFPENVRLLMLSPKFVTGNCEIIANKDSASGYFVASGYWHGYLNGETIEYRNLDAVIKGQGNPGYLTINLVVLPTQILDSYDNDFLYDKANNRNGVSIKIWDDLPVGRVGGIHQGALSGYNN